MPDSSTFGVESFSMSLIAVGANVTSCLTPGGMDKEDVERPE